MTAPAFGRLKRDVANKHRDACDGRVSQKLPRIIRVPLRPDLCVELTGSELDLQVLEQQLEIVWEVRVDDHARGTGCHTNRLSAIAIVIDQNTAAMISSTNRSYVQVKTSASGSNGQYFRLKNR